MNPVEVGPVPAADRRQSATDLFLIFAAANIVATTMVTGASLVPAFGAGEALGLIVLGTLLGSALVAVLAAVGPRYGAPSVVVARAALGRNGAALLALLLFLGNFAWIALNNVIAASACARLGTGAIGERTWSLALGLAATAVVALGPRMVGLADRVAVPLMLVLGVVLLVRALDLPPSLLAAPGHGGMSWTRGLDVVVGYQVSWLLMFADYSRYTPSEGRSGLAVFLGLALTSLWFMPLGALGALAAGSADPGLIVSAAGPGAAGALLLAVATVTTNFVNIYLSALALKSLAPGVPSRPAVWVIGGVGTALGLATRVWLDHYVAFMLVLGGVLVPVGGVLASRLLRRGAVDVEALYAPRGRYAGFDRGALLAWLSGTVAYFAAEPIGGTLPALAVGVTVGALTAPRAAGAGRSR